MSLSEAFVQSLWPWEWNFVSRTQMWFSSTQNICYCTWQRQQPKDTFNFKHIFYWTWQRQQPKDTFNFKHICYLTWQRQQPKETFKFKDICLVFAKKNLYKDRYRDVFCRGSWHLFVCTKDISNKNNFKLDLQINSVHITCDRLLYNIRPNKLQNNNK